MIIKLPRGIKVDTDNIRTDLAEVVQKAFAQYTEGTNPAYMYQDKLCFIDAMARCLHHVDAHDKVTDAIKRDFCEYLDGQGEIMDESEFLDVEYMKYCYKLGSRDMELYSVDFSGSHHDNENIMKIECIFIKAVMDYKEGDA